jgi:predicted dehydrogenase
MGRFHAARLAENSSIEFVACHDIDSSKSASLAKEYNIENFDNIESIIDNNIDAVSVAVPTVSHYDVASKFLEAGVAVLLEKPITGDLESAEKLASLSEKKDVVLQIGHSERFNPAYLAVESGISDPKFIETHRLAPFKGRGDDVAVILDLMIHDLDLILAMTGTMPDRIDAAGVAVLTDTVDIANARLSFADGCVANITASRISPKEMRKVRIFQKSGYTSIDMAARKAEQYRVVESDEEAYRKAPIFGKFNLSDGRAVVRNTVEIPPGDNLKYEISSFIETIRGEHPPVISGRDGLNVLKVATQIERLCRDYLENL